MTIELKDITKTFVDRSWRTLLLGKKPKRVRALNGVSLEVGPGEICGILGPNGAGKTTLIKILATLIIPDSGSAGICGYDLADQPQHVRRLIGLVNTSERSFYWRLTGRENLQFYASLYRIPRQQAKKHIDELLNLVDLIEKGDIRFQNYSTGMRQKLAIARGLLSNPRVLFVDEPTRSLDPISANAVRQFLKEKASPPYQMAATMRGPMSRAMLSEMALAAKPQIILSRCQ